MANSNKKIIFTTSWDDGHQLDLRLADLLDRYGIKGTFYVPRFFDGRLSDQEIKKISSHHEIGAHTVNHAFLLETDKGAATREITESKEWLTNLIGQPVKMFSYPKGQYDLQIKALVQAAGFSGARTVDIIKDDYDRFALPVSLQVYPFPFRRRSAQRLHWSKFLLEPLFYYWPVIRKYHISARSLFNWNSFARDYFRLVQRKGGVFHLWGHSWEIEKYGLWNELEKFLKIVSLSEDVLLLTNCQLLEYYEDINIK